jgi:hypothetical protein
MFIDIWTLSPQERSGEQKCSNNKNFLYQNFLWETSCKQVKKITYWVVDQL